MPTRRSRSARPARRATSKMKKTIRARSATGRIVTFRVGDRVQVMAEPHLQHHYKPELVRGCFVQAEVLEPHGRNRDVPACVLSSTSWAPCSQLKKV